MLAATGMQHTRRHVQQHRDSRVNVASTGKTTKTALEQEATLDARPRELTNLGSTPRVPGRPNTDS
jgi:hypothetical protein